MTRFVRTGLCALALLGGAPVLAGPVPWPDSPYSYFASNQRLENVLAEFASGFSLSLSLSPDVGGVVNGRFTSKNPTEFITRLAGVYGFVWYTHAGTLFVSRASDITTRGIPVPGGSIPAMRKALTDLGVLDARFGWGELPDQGMVLVSGPPSYVNQVEATLRHLPVRTPQALQVFRLKHASAEDRTVMYRDREITTPGLASILRDLVAGRASSGNDALAAMAAPLRSAPAVASSSTGAMPSAASGAAAPAPAATATVVTAAGPPAGGAREATPAIQADPRLNALIIQDTPERMPAYARLIAELDVPTELVEIEAMIIDVNSERARELGINWAGREGNRAAGFGRLADPQPGTLTIARGPDNTISTSSLLVASGNYLISQIRLLETEGDAQIQSRPSVLTSENLGALLDLSETFYIRVLGERVATVTPVTAGTTLRVTPRVVREGQQRLVQLKVDIEDGQIQDRQVDTLPTVRRSSVSTQAMVGQDEVLLIAGYATDQSVINNDKVPIVGDIPGVGLLFSNKVRSLQKRERLFLIRPKVVSVNGLPPAGPREFPPPPGAAPQNPR